MPPRWIFCALAEGSKHSPAPVTPGMRRSLLAFLMLAVVRCTRRCFRCALRSPFPLPVPAGLAPPPARFRPMYRDTSLLHRCRRIITEAARAVNAGGETSFGGRGTSLEKEIPPPAPSPKKSDWVLYLIPSQRASRRGSFCRKSADLFTLIGFFLGERENPFPFPKEKGFSQKLSIVSRGGRIGP